jgi:hypothetical protein
VEAHTPGKERGAGDHPNIRAPVRVEKWGWRRWQFLVSVDNQEQFVQLGVVKGSEKWAEMEDGGSRAWSSSGGGVAATVVPKTDEVDGLRR